MYCVKAFDKNKNRTQNSKEGAVSSPLITADMKHIHVDGIISSVGIIQLRDNELTQLRVIITLNQTLLKAKLA